MVVTAEVLEPEIHLLSELCVSSVTSVVRSGIAPPYRGGNSKSAFALFALSTR